MRKRVQRMKVRRVRMKSDRFLLGLNLADSRIDTLRKGVVVYAR